MCLCPENYSPFSSGLKGLDSVETNAIPTNRFFGRLWVTSKIRLECSNHARNHKRSILRNFNEVGQKSSDSLTLRLSLYPLTIMDPLTKGDFNQVSSDEEVIRLDWVSGISLPIIFSPFSKSFVIFGRPLL